MKALVITESDGSQRLINPMYITNVKLIFPNLNQDWAVEVFINDKSSNPMHIQLFHSEEEARERFAEILKCIESI